MGEPRIFEALFWMVCACGTSFALGRWWNGARIRSERIAAYTKAWVETLGLLDEIDKALDNIDPWEACKQARDLSLCGASKIRDLLRMDASGSG